jgi:hypothetical protein
VTAIYNIVFNLTNNLILNKYFTKKIFKFFYLILNKNHMNYTEIIIENNNNNKKNIKKYDN